MRLPFAMAILCCALPAHAAPSLLHETFATPTALAAWVLVDGAVDGEGPSSEITFDDGAARFAANASTKHWRALERTLRIDGTANAALHISARMKTDGLTVDGKHRAINYIYVRFADASGKRVGDLAVTRSLFGTQPWTTIARRMDVPPGATTATVGLFVALPGHAWFDDLEVTATTPVEWHEATSGNYHYHWLDGDVVDERARSFNNESYRLVATFLGRADAPAIQYFKYPDKPTKEELMGDPGNAFTLPDGSIHSIFASDRHEIVHVLARPWGDPPALVGEGLAVFLSGAWQGQPIAQYAKRLAQTEWIPVAALLDTSGFRAHSDLATYAIAGAFVEWLLAQPNGKAQLQALYGALRNRSSLAENRHVMETTLGKTLEQIDAALRAWLATR